AGAAGAGSQGAESGGICCQGFREILPTQLWTVIHMSAGTAGACFRTQLPKCNDGKHLKSKNFRCFFQQMEVFTGYVWDTGKVTINSVPLPTSLFTWI